MDAIRTSAKTQIERQFSKYQDNPSGFFEGENFDWYYQDLLLVEEMLVDKFPADWKVRLNILLASHKSQTDNPIDFYPILDLSCLHQGLSQSSL
jgi:hypothetical protein